LVEEGEIDVSYVPTDENAADILTKPLLKEKHMKMRTLLGLKSIPLLLLMMGMLICQAGASNQGAAPIVWRKSAIPVLHGSNQVNMMIQFVSPCELITNETIHSGLVEKARTTCSKMYAGFLDDMSLMCPPEFNAHLRPRRGAGAAVGIVIVGAVVGTGIYAIVSNRQRLNSLEEKVVLDGDTMEKLRLAFNQAMKRMEIHQSDHDELKGKTVKASCSSHTFPQGCCMEDSFFYKPNGSGRRKEKFILPSWISSTLPFRVVTCVLSNFPELRNVRCPKTKLKSLCSSQLD
jgi:hypothetical protein